MLLWLAARSRVLRRRRMCARAVQRMLPPHLLSRLPAPCWAGSRARGAPWCRWCTCGASSPRGASAASTWSAANAPSRLRSVACGDAPTQSPSTSTRRAAAPCRRRCCTGAYASWRAARTRACSRSQARRPAALLLRGATHPLLTHACAAPRARGRRRQRRLLLAVRGRHDVCQRGALRHPGVFSHNLGCDDATTFARARVRAVVHRWLRRRWYALASVARTAALRPTACEFFSSSDGEARPRRPVSAGFGFPGLLEKLGVERRLYTAGASKAQLDPFLPEKPEEARCQERLAHHSTPSSRVALTPRACLRRVRAG